MWCFAPVSALTTYIQNCCSELSSRLWWSQKKKGCGNSLANVAFHVGNRTENEHVELLLTTMTTVEYYFSAPLIRDRKIIA